MRFFHRIVSVFDRIMPSVFIRARVKPYFQDTLHRVLPFAVRVPNNETIEAMRQAGTGVGLNEYADMEALKTEHRLIRTSAQRESTKMT